MEKGRRRRTRVPINFDVFVDIHGEQIPVKTWDLSLRGMKCSPDTRFKEGDICQVIFILSPEVRVRIESKILRANKDEAGIYFSNMEEDSFYHLKRLVQYNTADPDKIDTELATPFEGC